MEKNNSMEVNLIEKQYRPSIPLTDGASPFNELCMTHKELAFEIVKKSINTEIKIRTKEAFIQLMKELIGIRTLNKNFDPLFENQFFTTMLSNVITPHIQIPSYIFLDEKIFKKLELIDNKHNYQFNNEAQLIQNRPLLKIFATMTKKYKLLEAVEAREHDKAQELITVGGINLRECDDYFLKQLLNYAKYSKYGLSISFLKMLVNNGMNPNTRYDFDNNSLIHTALLYTMTDEIKDGIKFFIEKGALINHQNSLRETALTMLVSAVATGKIKGNDVNELANLFLTNGADKDLKQFGGKTASGLARSYNNEILADYIDNWQSNS